jgi:hypothetical protein
MSNRKLDDIEDLFKKTIRPSLVIEDIPLIKKLGVILDDTKQGEMALQIACALAKKVNASVIVSVTGDFYKAFKILIESTNAEINHLNNFAKNFSEETGVKTEIRSVISSKIEQILEIFQVEVKDSEKLGGRLIAEWEGEDEDILIMGVPLFQSREDNEAENLGTYVTKLLSERRISSNFLLVPDHFDKDLKDSLLAFVSVEQQPGSILALTRRGLSLSSENTKFQIVGLIGEKLIETLARVDKDEEENKEFLDFETASKRLKDVIDETLNSIVIKEGIPHGSFSHVIETGLISSIVKNSLEINKPGIVLVRTVAELAENLDPFALQIIRVVLSSGYPCLVVWD